MKDKDENYIDMVIHEVQRLSDEGKSRVLAEACPERLDVDLSLERELIDGWQKLDTTGYGVTSKVATDLIYSGDAHPLRAVIEKLTNTPKGQQIDPIKLSAQLRRLKQCTIGGKRFECAMRDNTAAWKVVDLRLATKDDLVRQWVTNNRARHPLGLSVSDILTEALSVPIEQHNRIALLQVTGVLASLGFTSRLVRHGPTRRQTRLWADASAASSVRQNPELPPYGQNTELQSSGLDAWALAHPDDSSPNLPKQSQASDSDPGAFSLLGDSPF